MMNLKKILKPGKKHKLCSSIQQDQMNSLWQKLHYPFMGNKQKC